MKKALVIITLLIIHLNHSGLIAQLKTNPVYVSGDVNYSDVSYSYDATANFKVTVEGLLVDIIVSRSVSNYKITSYNYKGISASEVGYSFPIAINRYKKKVYVDIEFYKGNTTYRASNLEPDGSTYLSDQQLNGLFSRFNIDPKKRSCATCDALEDVKKLNIRALNVRLTDLKYLNLFSEINKKIEAKISSEKKQKETALKEAELKDSDKESKEEDEEENEEDSEEDSDNENDETSAYKKQLEEERKAREREEAKRRAREEAERKRKERKAKYDKRIKEQRKANERTAMALGASSVGLLYALGGFIYDNIDKPVEMKDGLIFTGNSEFLSLDLGYTSTLIPYAFNSFIEKYDGNNYTYKNETIGAYGISVNFNLGIEIGYEHEYGGGYAFGDISMGINPMLLAYSGFNYNYGSRIFAGSEGIKLFFEYEAGERAHTSIWDIAPEELGEGHTNIEFQNFKAGIKFSWYNNSRDPYRNHVYLGVIEETITNYDDTGFYVQTIKDLEEPTFFSKDKKAYLGYMGEWKYDNHSSLTLKFFPSYPFTGYRSGENIDVKSGPLSEELRENAGFPFIQVGFVRSMDAFNIFK